MLMFNVADLQERVTTMLQMGASLDGAIQYTVEGKVGWLMWSFTNITVLSIQAAALRAPDGQMISLFEPETPQAP